MAPAPPLPALHPDPSEEYCGDGLAVASYGGGYGEFFVCLFFFFSLFLYEFRDIHPI